MKYKVTLTLSRTWVKPNDMPEQDYNQWFDSEWEYEFSIVPNIKDIIDLEYIIKTELHHIYKNDLKTMLFEVVNRILWPIDNSGITSHMLLEIIPHIPINFYDIEVKKIGHLDHLKRNEYVIYQGGLNRKNLADGTKYRLTGKPYTHNHGSFVRIVDDAGGRLRLRQDYFKETFD